MSYQTDDTDIFLEFSKSYKNKITSNISEASTQNSKVSFSKRKSSLSNYYYTLKNLVHPTNTYYNDIENIIDMHIYL